MRLLQLFFRALADGDKSLFYKSLIDSKTRELDSGATSVESLVFLGESPHFPAEFVGFSGIPGNQLNEQRIEQLRSRITATIRQIAEYPDNSKDLVDFNQLVASQAKAWRRSQSIWIRNAPKFGLNYETGWKEYFEYLDMDPSFIRPISDEPVWTTIEARLKSGKNIWARTDSRLSSFGKPLRNCLSTVTAALGKTGSRPADAQCLPNQTTDASVSHR